MTATPDRRPVEDDPWVKRMLEQGGICALFPVKPFDYTKTVALYSDPLAPLMVTVAGRRV